MFENRSFDHLLGDMPGVNGLFDADGQLKPNAYNYTNPLKPDPTERQVPFPIQPGELEYVYTVSGDHDFSAMLNDLAGPETTGVLNGQPLGNSQPTHPFTNCGFVNANPYEGPDANKRHYKVQHPIMSYFEWGSMQVFHKLAAEFVVCDNWFCDMPGHTAPNRAFMHCATTGELGIDNNTANNGDDAANEEPDKIAPIYHIVNRKTIFERLEECQQTWKMYVPGGLNGAADSNGTIEEVNPSNNLDTDYLNANVSQRYWTENGKQYPINCTDVPLQQFYKDAQLGELPTYSFIMCWTHLPGKDTSMHPAGTGTTASTSSVKQGENLLAGVYNTLRNSPCWEDTLLIVNFDENGGLYDHVCPPRAVPPDPDDKPQTTVINGTIYCFDYSILGFRIPALLISPWLKKGIESQQLQNTSVLRFLQDHFCAAPDQAGAPPADYYLTQRDRFANSIQVAFDDFGLTAPRKDCLPHVETYKIDCYDNGIDEKPSVGTPQLQLAPQEYMVETTLEYVGGLPGHADSGHPIKRQFTTTKELIDYSVERKEAALAYYSSPQLA